MDLDRYRGRLVELTLRGDPENWRARSSGIPASVVQLGSRQVQATLLRVDQVAVFVTGLEAYPSGDFLVNREVIAAVAVVTQVEDPLWNGVVIGAGAAAGYGLAVVLGAGDIDTSASSLIPAFALAGGVGALIGGLIDKAKKATRRVVVYQQ